MDCPSPGANSGAMRGYLVQPAGEGAFPAVLAIDENRGLDPHIEDVARHAAFKGSQIHAVPADVDANAYQGIVVWCNEFGVLISPAGLTRQTAGPEQHR